MSAARNYWPLALGYGNPGPFAGAGGAARRPPPLSPLLLLSALLNTQPNRYRYVFLHVFILQTWTSFILHKPPLSVLQLPSKKLATGQVVPNKSRTIRHRTITPDN